MTRDARSFERGLTARCLRAAGLCVCATISLTSCSRQERIDSQSSPIAAAPVDKANTNTANISNEVAAQLQPPPAQQSQLSQTPTPPSSAPPRLLFTPVTPFVRVSREAGIVELDGSIAIDVHGATPRVYLEVLVCSPNTREHEALVVTKANARDVHAALLLLGIESGSPGSFAWKGQQLVSVKPSGPALRVQVQVANASQESPWTDIMQWVTSPKQVPSESKPSEIKPGDFVFAGSTFRTMQGREVYAADAEGTIVGLTTFGTETVALTTVYNPDAATEEPHLMARAEVLPKHNTAVKVRIALKND